MTFTPFPDQGHFPLHPTQGLVHPSSNCWPLSGRWRAPCPPQLTPGPGTDLCTQACTNGPLNMLSQPAPSCPGWGAWVRLQPQMCTSLQARLMCAHGGGAHGRRCSFSAIHPLPTRFLGCPLPGPYPGGACRSLWLASSPALPPPPPSPSSFASLVLFLELGEFQGLRGGTGSDSHLPGLVTLSPGIHQCKGVSPPSQG